MDRYLISMLGAASGISGALAFAAPNHIGLGSAAVQAHENTSIPVNSERSAYFGDLHLHTAYSFDAYAAFGARIEPDQAYRFARGDAVSYLGRDAQRSEPLDFMAVTDHAEAMGILGSNETWTSLRSNPRMASIAKRWLSTDQQLTPELRARTASAWERSLNAANKYYRPGEFTTFVAYEWTGSSNVNLHRNVIFRGNTAPSPFTANDSGRPEDLWAWLTTIRRNGYEALAIPHNGNRSNGLMYDWVTSEGKPIDRDYAIARANNEPLSEIGQNKGASETSPLLSPSDELSGFEIMDFPFSGDTQSGGYLRNALGRGLIVQGRLGVNPFKYGFVGGSDLHSGLSVSSQEEFNGGHQGTNLGGNVAGKERSRTILTQSRAKFGDAELPATEPGKRPEGIDRMHSSGYLTGVWAESNTRQSIFDALRRREAFATSGTRLRIRFFGGWAFSRTMLNSRDWVRQAYASGAPMGGDLSTPSRNARAPRFVIWAVKDPNGANLDRAQVIKVWQRGDKHFERVYDVVWAGESGRRSKGKLRPIENTVDLRTGKFSNSVGAVELKTVWRDPNFDPKLSATYYLRVLEIPTPRWTTLLAIKHGLPLPHDVPATLQQRAWSSPIWYTPSPKAS